ncbi:MAG: hypothetical protein AAGD00_01960 [Planctomycetota bacterium]
MDEPIDSAPMKVKQLRQITERRPCLSCGYDLRGQPVWQEEHYGWYITRCTECGFVSPMGSFDMTAKILRVTAGRAAGGWILSLLVLWAAMGGVSFAMSQWGMQSLAISGQQAMAGFAILWMIVVSFIGGALICALSPDARTPRFMWMGLPALAVTMLWWAGTLSYQFEEEQDWGLTAIGNGGWARLLIMLGVQAAILLAVFMPMRAIMRAVFLTLAPPWVGATMPGLWRADDLELPGRFGGERDGG